MRLAAAGIAVAVGGPFVAGDEHEPNVRVTAGRVAVEDAPAVAVELAAAARATLR